MFTRRRSFTLLALAALSLWFGLQIHALLRAPAEGQGASRDHQEMARTLTVDAALTDYAPPQIDTMNDLFARPPFRPERRPPDTAPSGNGDGARPEEKPFGATLKGVVVSGPIRYAIVEPSSGGEPTRLRQGDRYQGWRLDEIHVDRILLTRGNRTTVLHLAYRSEGSP